MNSIAMVAKHDLSFLIPAQTLGDLIPSFEAAWQEEGGVCVTDASGAVLYSSLRDAQTCDVHAPIVIEREVMGQVGLCARDNQDQAARAAAFLAQSLSYLALENRRNRQLADEVLARYDELNLVYDLGALISNQGLSQDEIVRTVLIETNRILDAEAGAIFIYDDKQAELTPVSFFGQDDPAFWRGRVRELALSIMYAYETAQLLDGGRVLCAPLRHGEERLGALVLMYGDQNKTFSANDMNLLTTLTYNTALFIQAAHLYEHLRQRNLELEQALNDLKSARDELSRAQQLSLIGQTVGGLIHDMRNPLNVVMGYAGLLQEGGLSADESREYSTQIIQYVTTFSSMAQEILDYTQSNDRLEKKVVTVEDYLDFIYNLLNPPGLTRSIQISLNVDAARGSSIDIDPQRFSRVFQNLVNNAIDAIEEHGGSRVEIRAETLPDQHLRFMVLDDGPGVPQDMVEKIFEPFVTGKSHGTGLGLAIVERMIAKHGGAIHYETGPNGGACFVFTLPRAD